MTRARCGAWRWSAAAMAVIGMTGCAHRAAPAAAEWDASRAEVVAWRADHPAFAVERQLEASGLAAAAGALWVTSEKYAAVLRVEEEPPHEAAVLRLEVPPLAELEGVTVDGDWMYLCDEAHAAVYQVPLAGGVPARRLELEGVDVQGGKVGYEGVAVEPGGEVLWLLLERSGDAASGCTSTLFRLARRGDRLVRDARLEVPMPACNFRLPGIELWRGRLLALMTSFPGEEYRIVEIDPSNGEARTLLDLTALTRALGARGYATNLEGLAVGEDGALWLVSDNAVTVTAETPDPPPAKETTLLLRLPPAAGR